MTPHLLAARYVFYVLCGLCVAASLAALFSLSLWALVFAGLAWGCFEAAES